MKHMDIQVYKQLRKVPGLPSYEFGASKPFKLCRSVPILIVTPDDLNRILVMEYADIIKRHNGHALLILTDRKRVLAIEPQGYDYLKYAWTIDEKTVQNILSRV